MIFILFIQDESCPSKSLLLELTQREGYSKPTYTTTESGSPHMPTYYSTVEVEGLKFHGKASRSKKQADSDAAKIAYIALKECKFIRFIFLSFIRITNKFGLYYYVDIIICFSASLVPNTPEIWSLYSCYIDAA